MSLSFDDWRGFLAATSADYGASGGARELPYHADRSKRGLPLLQEPDDGESGPCNVVTKPPDGVRTP